MGIEINSQAHHFNLTVELTTEGFPVVAALSEALIMYTMTLSAPCQLVCICLLISDLLCRSGSPTMSRVQWLQRPTATRHSSTGLLTGSRQTRTRRTTSMASICLYSMRTTKSRRSWGSDSLLRQKGPSCSRKMPRPQ